MQTQNSVYFQPLCTLVDENLQKSAEKDEDGEEEEYGQEEDVEEEDGDEENSSDDDSWMYPC